MKRETTTIAIVSGKGGVGKSVVAANVAETLAWAGHRVAILDADLGQGAQRVLFNEGPDASVLDCVERRVRAEALFYETASGVTLVEGAREPVDTPPVALFDGMDEVLMELREAHRFVLIDAPAGSDTAVRWALDRADFGLVVVVGEPTAVADAYRLAKTIWALDEDYPLALVVNYADTRDEAESVAERFAQITRQFAGRVPAYLGWVPYASEIRRSVAAQMPAVRSHESVRPYFNALAQVLEMGRMVQPEAVPLSSL